MRSQFTPSPTALLSAAARAAHSLIDHEPHLIDDAIAVRICERFAPEALNYHRSFPSEPVLAAARLSACARRRFAEDVAAERGFTQCLLLGGGLDAELGGAVTTWVADRPEVLQWRRNLFASVGTADPSSLMPINLGTDDLEEALANSRIDRDKPMLVVWLGVSMYLNRQEIEDTLGALTTLPAQSSVVFDYVLPAPLRDQRGREYAAALSSQAAGGGEPWKALLAPGDVVKLFEAVGWSLVRDIPEAEAVGDGFWPRRDGLVPMRLIRLVWGSLRE